MVFVLLGKLLDAVRMVDVVDNDEESTLEASLPLSVGPNVCHIVSAAAMAASSLTKPPSKYVAPPILSSIFFPNVC